MKKFMILGVLGIFLLTSCANQHHVNQFYNKYQGTENTTSFKAPLFLASMLMENNAEYNQLRQKIKSVRVLTMDELNNEKSHMVQNDIKMALQKDGFENWFSMNENGRVIQVSTKNRGKSLKNLVISMQGEERLIFINAKTNLTETELAKFLTAVMQK